MADEKTAKDLEKEIESLNKKLKEAGGFGIDFADTIKKANGNTQELNKTIEKLNKEYEDLVDNAEYIYRTFQEITAELKNQNLLLKIGKGSFKAFTDIAQDLNYYQKGTNDLTDKQFKKISNNIANEKKELQFVVERLNASRRATEIEKIRLENQLKDDKLSGKSRNQINERLKAIAKENELLVNAKETLKSGIPLLEQELDFTKKIADTRESLGGIAQAAGKTISKYAGSLSSFLKIDEATEKVEEFNKKLIKDALEDEAVRNKLLDIEKRRKELEEAGTLTEEERLKLEKEAYSVKQDAVASVDTRYNKLSSLLVLTKGLGEGLKKSLNDPLVIISFILDRANQFNKTSVDIGKNLGTGTKESDKLAQNLADVANNSTNLNVTFKNVAEAMGELNTTTGGVANYSADTLETQIMLTKQLGLTGEEAAGLYKFSVLTGKASSDINDAMVGAFAATRNAVKGSANFKATMAEVSKISGQLAINFKNNPAELTKAVVQAQALGTTLEKTKNQGASLLNFESSIEDELKAELLTGQQMNLERARAAALQGDQVTVMKELANQGMTLEKFQSMNVIAQESFAKALGLSADELSNQLNKQKIAQEQGKSLAEITKEEALEAEKRQATQEKFALALEKLKDIVGNLVGGPFAMLLELLGQALNIVGYIVKPIEWLKSLATSIGETFAGWADALGPFGILLKAIAGIAILLAAYGAYAALAWIPVVGPLLGAAAAVAVTSAGFSALSSQKVGDMMSPADGKTQVSTKEGGLFELSKNDDLIAAPGAAKAMKGKKDEGMAAPSIDLTPMIAAINSVKASIDRLYAKDSSIHMDGKKVGTTLTQNSHKVA